MNKNTLKVLQTAGESLSKLETLSLLRMTCLPQTKDEFSLNSAVNANRYMRSLYSTSSTRRYGLDELIPKSPILPVGTTEEEASLVSTEAREKLAQQHQTSNATVVGTLTNLH